MEPKKNPTKDVHRYAKQFFTIGLLISLSLVIVAFEWTSVKSKPTPREPIPIETIEMTYIPITQQIPDIPKPVKKSLVLNPTKIEAAEPDIEPLDIDIQIEPEIITNVPVKIEATLPAEPVDSVFIRVEKMPEPEGGYSKFYDLLRRNLRYPKVAKRMGTEGFVTVQFVINEKGKPSDFKILKSLGSGLDEEAIRVISLSQWTPGKQRGRAVKVSMVQPIYFALQ